MSRSLIQTSNQSAQAVAVGGIRSLGSTLRRFGCNCRLSGNGIEVMGEGYYTIDANVSVTPTAAGAITIALFQDGVQIPGAIAFTTGGAGTPIEVSIPTTIRLGCCDSSSTITCVLVEGAGTVDNIAVRVVKE